MRENMRRENNIIRKILLGTKAKSQSKPSRTVGFGKTKEPPDRTLVRALQVSGGRLRTRPPTVAQRIA